ncbi:MAG TPA: flagellar biosynthesis protein FlhF [Lacipirellulaceae bacterium]|nr:flagellar biosynthesis protein FlhF [Lacipirellulaceae bacterium]
MEIKTYRAKSMRDALDLVRRELGPSAAVLHTREVNSGLLGRVLFGRQYEVAASAAVNVPSRLPAAEHRAWSMEHGVAGSEQREVSRAYHDSYSTLQAPSSTLAGPSAAHLDTDYRARYRDDFRHQVAGQLDELHAMVEKLCERAASAPAHELPEAMFHAFTDMIEAEIEESIARSWIDRVREGRNAHELADTLLVKARVAQLLEDEIKVSGPITIDADRSRVVALVGPTGVGKTTTIAKLAANYRLREKRRVGLITVDTYRVAAVEQLRTYADIIDLPMEVVATPREMREAVARMSHLDLVLMDTAGRSPRDEVKIQELKSMLGEAEPDEVHLVLSSTAGAKSLLATAERFVDVGTTALVLTKLDEASSLGHLVSLVRECRLPVSYLTDGQNVPDDIEVAERRRLAYMLLGIE